MSCVTIYVCLYGGGGLGDCVSFQAANTISELIRCNFSSLPLDRSLPTLNVTGWQDCMLRVTLEVGMELDKVPCQCAPLSIPGGLQLWLPASNNIQALLFGPPWHPKCLLFILRETLSEPDLSLGTQGECHYFPYSHFSQPSSSGSSKANPMCWSSV